MTDPTSLEGKLALVTGAGTGIGRGGGVGTGPARGRRSAALFVERCRRAGSCGADSPAMGRRAVAIQGDLGKVDGRRRLVDQAAEYLGGLDGLVSNAGITADL